MANQLSVGLDLDAAVAREVMGLDGVKTGRAASVPCIVYKDECGGLAHVPHYSTDIAAAMEVVEKLRADDWLVVLKWLPEKYGMIVEGSRSEYDEPCPDMEMAGTKGKVCCELQDMAYLHGGNKPWRHSTFAICTTAAEAICRVALEAVKG